MTTQPEVDKVQGCLIGFAIGDALGAPYEFERQPIEIEMTFKEGVFGTRPGEGTDDSWMARCAAEAIVDGKIDISRYLDNLSEWAWEAKDIGNQTYRSVHAWRDGRRLAPDDTALGNGSLLTTHVAACFLTEDEAAEISSATHPAPKATKITRYLYRRIATELGRPHAVITRPDHMLIDTSLTHQRPIGLGEKTYSVAVEALAECQTAADALGALQRVVERGGDTDSNAAVAGGLLGARFGMAAWNSFEELGRLEMLDYWMTVANEKVVV